MTRRTGLALLALAALIAVGLVYGTLHVMATNAYLHSQCPLPADVCPINRGVPTESLIGFGGDIALAVYAVWLIRRNPLAKPERAREGPAPGIPRHEPPPGLIPDERRIFELLQQSENIALQGDLVERSGFSKVKVSRLLDHLEARGLVERRRRGMSNVVVLK